MTYTPLCVCLVQDLLNVKQHWLPLSAWIAIHNCRTRKVNKKIHMLLLAVRVICIQIYIKYMLWLFETSAFAALWLHIGYVLTYDL